MRIENKIKGSVDLASGVITIEDTETTVNSAFASDPMEPITRHYRSVLDTKEGMVREALIKLGWTPPA